MKPLLVVDGYNVIGCWSQAEREKWPLDACRDRLMHLLQDYSGFAGEEIVLVFDGWQSDRPTTTVEVWEGISVVYTRHGETADSYIERLVAQTPRYRMVRVATSDGLEQSQVLSTGAVRMTSRELLRELHQTKQQGMVGHQLQAGIQRSRLESHLPDKTREALERLRHADFEPERMSKEKPGPPVKDRPADTGMKIAPQTPAKASTPVKKSMQSPAPQRKAVASPAPQSKAMGKAPEGISGGGHGASVRKHPAKDAAQEPRGRRR